MIGDVDPRAWNDVPPDGGRILSELTSPEWGAAEAADPAGQAWRRAALDRQTRGAARDLLHSENRLPGAICHDRLRHPAAPMGSRAHLLVVGRNRRLNKDYENLADTLAAFVTVACIQLGVRRLTRR